MGLLIRMVINLIPTKNENNYTKHSAYLLNCHPQQIAIKSQTQRDENDNYRDQRTTLTSSSSLSSTLDKLTLYRTPTGYFLFLSMFSYLLVVLYPRRSFRKSSITWAHPSPINREQKQRNNNFSFLIPNSRNATNDIHSVTTKSLRLSSISTQSSSSSAFAAHIASCHVERSTK